jgi:hypothetical protein
VVSTNEPDIPKSRESGRTSEREKPEEYVIGADGPKGFDSVAGGETVGDGKGESVSEGTGDIVAD